jgi:hypothetical protein
MSWVSKTMLSIAKLLWLDEEFIEREALPEAFGDRYLFANNPLFAKVRSLFLSFGFRYSSEPTRFWRDYDSMSLLMLQEILDSGVVPYKDNTKTLKRFSEKCPSLEMPANLLLTLLQRNYLMHESAHCISHRILSSQFGGGKQEGQKEQYVLTSILNEAYANTVERIGAALAGSNHHRLFYTLNSYTDGRGDMGSLLRDSLRVFGLPKTFLMGILASFYLNTHENNPQSETTAVIIDIVSDRQQISESERALMRIVINNGFGLSMGFRTQTNPLFFRYVGCQKEFEDLCQQSFEPATMSSGGLWAAISTLSAATCQGLEWDVPIPQVSISTEMEMEGSLLA